MCVLAPLCHQVRTETPVNLSQLFHFVLRQSLTASAAQPGLQSSCLSLAACSATVTDQLELVLSLFMVLPPEF